MAIVDSKGVKLAEYLYDAWGNSEVINLTSANLGDVNPFRYRGYYYDLETGLYYLNSRYYDPEVGRFISADSINYLDLKSINGLNLYSYCKNNPIMMVDPDGHFPFLIAMALIGLAIGATWGGVSAYNNGARGWDVVKGAAIGGAIGFGVGLAVGGLVSAFATGSFLTSISGVGKGIMTVAGMFKAGGFGAGMIMMGDNFMNAVHSFQHVFWSGGYLDENGNVVNVAKTKAAELANSIGGKTLEMTRLGMYLERIGASSQAWSIASQNFASQISYFGTAHAVLYYPGMSEAGVWLTVELPELIRRFIEVTIGG